MVGRPFFVANPLVVFEVRVRFHFGPFPGGFSGTPTYGLFAMGLVLVPGTGNK
jgi:hypothetical protein